MQAPGNVFILSSAEFDNTIVGLISQILVVRALHVLHMVRALRLLMHFEQLWKFCSGLVRASHTVLFS